jgi:hypothetical protein
VRPTHTFSPPLQDEFRYPWRLLPAFPVDSLCAQRIPTTSLLRFSAIQNRWRKYNIIKANLQAVYRFTSCGTLGKSSISQLLPGLLSLSSRVVFSDYTPFQSTFRGGNSWCHDPPPPRSAERTLPEGPIEPFHHFRDVGDLGGRTKSLIPYSCEDPQIPHSIHSLQYLLV